MTRRNEYLLNGQPLTWPVDRIRLVQPIDRKSPWGDVTEWGSIFIQFKKEFPDHLEYYRFFFPTSLAGSWSVEPRERLIVEHVWVSNSGFLTVATPKKVDNSFTVLQTEFNQPEIGGLSFAVDGTNFRLLHNSLIEFA